MWVPLKEKEKKNKKLKSKQMTGDRTKWGDRIFLKKFFSFSFFLRFTETYPSEFVGINTKSALRDEGYA